MVAVARGSVLFHLKFWGSCLYIKPAAGEDTGDKIQFLDLSRYMSSTVKQRERRPQSLRYGVSPQPFPQVGSSSIQVSERYADQQSTQAQQELSGQRL